VYFIIIYILYSIYIMRVRRIGEIPLHVQVCVFYITICIFYIIIIIIAYGGMGDTAACACLRAFYYYLYILCYYYYYYYYAYYCYTDLLSVLIDYYYVQVLRGRCVYAGHFGPL